MVSGEDRPARRFAPGPKRQAGNGPLTTTRLVVARDGLDGGDHLVVGDLLGRPGEARVAAVHEDRPVALGVAAQGVDQLAALGVVEGAEIHRTSPYQNGNDQPLP